MFFKILKKITLVATIALVMVGTTQVARADGQIILDSTQYTLTPTSLQISGEAIGFTAPENIEVKYGTASTATGQTTGLFQVQPDTPFTKLIQGLTPSTQYYFQIVSSTGTVYVPPAAFQTTATTTGGVDLSSGASTVVPNCTAGTDGYCLLAPLGGINVITDSQLADYFGLIYKILIGLIGVLAVVMIFYGGVQYMTSDAIYDKSEGKERIKNAVFGLIIALGSYAILNTVNPDLLDFRFGINKVNISYTPDELLFAETEELAADNGGYVMSGTFFNPSPSAGVAAAAQKLNANYRISQITVNTSSSTATFDITNGTLSESFSIPVKLGKNGVAEIGQARSGDGKTPKGTTYINTDRRLSGNTTNAIFDRSGKYNMGAAFINIGTNPDRGIGFHGKASNGLTVTNGCIRMYNDDLVALAKHMKTGTKVVIQ